MVFGVVNGQSPEPRKLAAIRNPGKIKIDGILNDTAWKSAARMDSLVEFRPKVGAVEEYGVRTESYLLYDDAGIYFGGYVHA